MKNDNKKDQLEEKNKLIFENDDLFAEENKKKKKKAKLFLIIFGLLFFLIGIMYIISSLLFSKKDKIDNDKNIEYLTNTYGDNVKISFLNKRKNIYSYSICSKKTIYCVQVKYNELNNNWEYPNGESFVSAFLFMDQLVNILDKYNIDYKAFTDANTSHDIPNNFVLAIKKDDEASLINAIKSINDSNLIDNICGKDGDSCNANYHITIFNKDDYDIIVNKVKKQSIIKSYSDLYEILLKNDEVIYSSRLGENIERHSIDDNMFSCTDSDCNRHKHITYRYVPGNHNHVGSTIIVEGIN